jgi:hypothetical protein
MMLRYGIKRECMKCGQPTEFYRLTKRLAYSGSARRRSGEGLVPNPAAGRRPRIVAQACSWITIVGSRTIVVRGAIYATGKQPTRSKNADYQLHGTFPQNSAYPLDPRLRGLFLSTVAGDAQRL